MIRRPDGLESANGGKMSVPAAVRRRWGLDEGGRVTVIDLGEALVVLPAGARQQLLAAADADDVAFHAL